MESTSNHRALREHRRIGQPVSGPAGAVAEPRQTSCLGEDDRESSAEVVEQLSPPLRLKRLEARCTRPNRCGGSRVSHLRLLDGWIAP